MAKYAFGRIQPSHLQLNAASDRIYYVEMEVFDNTNAPIFRRVPKQSNTSPVAQKRIADKLNAAPTQGYINVSDYKSGNLVLATASIRVESANTSYRDSLSSDAAFLYGSMGLTRNIYVPSPLSFNVYDNRKTRIFASNTFLSNTSFAYGDLVPSKLMINGISDGYYKSSSIAVFDYTNPHAFKKFPPETVVAEESVSLNQYWF